MLLGSAVSVAGVPCLRSIRRQSGHRSADAAILEAHFGTLRQRGSQQSSIRPTLRQPHQQA